MNIQKDSWTPAVQNSTCILYTLPLRWKTGLHVILVLRGLLWPIVEISVMKPSNHLVWNTVIETTGYSHVNKEYLDKMKDVSKPLVKVSSSRESYI